MLILGVREMRKSKTGLAETAGLRQVLTAIAEANLPTPVITPEIQRFECPNATPEMLAKARAALRDEMEKPGTVLLENTEATGSRWLLKIPDPATRAFEWRLVGLGFTKIPVTSPPTPDDAFSKTAPHFLSGTGGQMQAGSLDQETPDMPNDEKTKESSRSSGVLYEIIFPQRQ